MAPYKMGRTVFIHGLGYFVPPAIMLACWYPFRWDEGEQRKMLEEKYSDRIKVSQQSNKNMQEFFDKVKSGDEDTNKKFEEVMNAGKKKVVRHYSLEIPEDGGATKSGAGAVTPAAPIANNTKLGSSRIEPR
mmetsp:Transcript_53925/g.92791  ORF Transcript_53925/g.92791 Transcript_53925/m.92791 type:complete len:132 (+) Transcript_53925:58-453(+)